MHRLTLLSAVSTRLVPALAIAALLTPRVACAQNATPEAALTALRAGLRQISSTSVDVDGDGDEDRIVQIDEGVEVNHCVITVHTATGWVSRAAVGLGGDRADRCVGVVSGRVVVAQMSPGAAEVQTVALFAARVTDSAITLGLQTVVRTSVAVTEFANLTAVAAGRQIAVEAPPHRRVGTLRI